MARTGLFLAAAVMLSACVTFGGAESETPRERAAGARGPVGECMAACDRSYGVCMDAGASGRRTENLPSMSGGAVCDRSLQSCRKDCR
ncbi:MAG: hypothetical protein IPI58_00250 [Alphaproteobacteria bacterium]|nr:MAG: hypothetical protein IPI58_00250 [Alphaproteobacteria bacterium]